MSLALAFVLGCGDSLIPSQPDAAVDSTFAYDGPEEGDACVESDPICADDHRPVPGVCIRGICRLQCYPRCPDGEVEMHYMRDTANVCYCAPAGDSR